MRTGRLRRFDAKLTARVPEAVVVQLLWCCLVHVPAFCRQLGVPPGLAWHLGATASVT